MNTESTAQARAKAAAKTHLEEYLRSAGIDTSANFKCFNHTAHAHDDRNPSMTFYADSNTCFCHVCRKHFDIFDAARALERLSGKALFDHVYKFCGITVGHTEQPLPATKSLHAPEAACAFTDKTDYFARCHADIAHTDYFEKRGICSQELIERFNLGYDRDTGFVIIPNSRYSYNARNTDPDCAKKDRYRKNPARTGRQHIFNIDIIGKTEKPVFIVEGEFDALSIMEAGGEAIALSSTAHADLVAYLKDCKPKQPCIIALDTDNAGKKASRELEKKLRELGFACVAAQAAPAQYKDANEFLVRDRQGFFAEIALANEDPVRYAYRQRSAVYGIYDFMKHVADRKGKNCFSTGFRQLDDALQGGLYAGLYIFGAVSSLGKTTFALQLADNAAKQRQHVLYFSCEMSIEELIAKSISRISFEHSVQQEHGNTFAQTTMHILNGSFLDKGERYVQAIDSALSAYAQYADNLFFHEGVGTISVDYIAQTVKKHIDATGKKPLGVRGDRIFSGCAVGNAVCGNGL